MIETPLATPYHLAVVNTAQLVPNPDIGELAKFKAAADPFMARVLSGNTALKAFVDPRENDLGNGIFSGNDKMSNLTVWETPEDLSRFLKEAHQVVYSRYGGLFAPLGQAAVALWWTPEGHVPDYVEAEKRLLTLRERGSTQYSFDFSTARNFPAPS